MNIALRRQSWTFVIGVFVLAGITVLVLPLVTVPTYLASISQACFSVLLMLSQMDPSFVIAYGTLLLLGVVGVIRAVIVLARELMVTVRLRRVYEQRTYEVRDEVSYVYDTTPFALTLGFIRPRIYISSALVETCTMREQEVIIAHERAHVIKRDSLTRLVVRVSSALLWFVPMTRHFQSIVVATQEQRADEGLDGTIVRSALTKILRSQLSCAGACHFESTLERIQGTDRIAMTCDTRQVVGSIVVAVGVLMMATSVHAKDREVRAVVEPHREGYCQALFWTPETGMSQIPMSVE